jgi:hypothetical protein
MELVGSVEESVVHRVHGLKHPDSCPGRATRKTEEVERSHLLVQDSPLAGREAAVLEGQAEEGEVEVEASDVVEGHVVLIEVVEEQALEHLVCQPLFRRISC